jgi:D-3-phosphoglycerate dehydrogenase
VGLLRIFLTYGPEGRLNYFREGAARELRSLGEVRMCERDEPLTSDELVAAARGCQVIVADRATRGDGSIFAALPELAAFMRCAVDVRNIDVDAASANGVLVTHAGPGFGNAVAEWVLGMMLSLSRHLCDSVWEYRSGKPALPRMGGELRGSTLGIVGYGHIGRTLGRLGTALGMRVLVADPLVAASEPGVEQRTLDEVLALADFVVCLAAATAGTHRLLNDDRFARMKHGAYFINASRGEVVDESALRSALDDGHLAGCALDVGSAPDQKPAPALAVHPRVLATPHVGGLTPQAVDRQANEVVAQLRELVAGRMPPGALNAAHARRLRSLH